LGAISWIAYERTAVPALIDAARAPLYEGRLPLGSDLAIPLAVAVLAAAGGWMVFRRLSRGFYPYL
jgi:ABC-type polysaccharide/polyol phosphate export permease